MQTIKPRMKWNKGLIFILLISVLLSLNFCTEEPYEPETRGTIEGNVLDEITNYGIANVTVTTEPSTKVILTDSSGYYKIANIDTGRYQVIAEKKNYETKRLGVQVREDETSDVKILMSNTEQYDSNIKFSENFSPKSGATGQELNVTLSWKAHTSIEDTSLTYDVQMYIGNTQKQHLVKKNLRDTFLHVESLHYNKIYYWQVIAKNNQGDTAHSKMLNFSTEGISENSFFFVRKIDGNYEIMAHDLDNNETNRITNNNYRDWAPKINEKNEKIAFVNGYEVDPYIYTMERNGDNLKKVSDIVVDGYHNQGNALAWDEEGGKILFSHYRNLYEMNSDGTELNIIATTPDDKHFREVDLSPDNSKIVALAIGEKIYNSEIYLMDRDGSNKEVLIDSLAGIVQSPTFSIEGNSILYTHDISGNESLDGRMLNSHIFRLNLETGDTTDISQNKDLGRNDLNPRYSPTGNKIIFTNVINDNSEPTEIWMMDVDGSNREKILDNGALPAWK